MRTTRIAVAETFGSLSVPTMRLETCARAEERSWWRPFDVGVAQVARDDPLAQYIEHFDRVVRREAAPIVRVRDSLQNLRITEAIVEAARSGSIVDAAPV
ncbi:hypothetical protein [Paraburkholderia sp. BL10I2N1]|uniref:hypothetical protein n=1 Tax=Paraburkholderia sp. BL10I2N1 TaxID=1938796 RepID=UPI00105E4A88